MTSIVALFLLGPACGFVYVGSTKDSAPAPDSVPRSDTADTTEDTPRETADTRRPDTGVVVIGDTTGAGGGDTAVVIIPGDTSETEPDLPDDPTWMFLGDVVYDVAITLPDASITALNADPDAYVTGDITFDGTTLTNVGIKLKGRLGSFRTLSQKAGFKVSLDTFVEDQEYSGLDHFTFNNLVQDSSYVHQPAAYAVYRAFGIPAPRIGYVWITVNGTDYGLYENAEGYDNKFVDRTYGDDSGSLYNGDYYLAPDWSYYVFTDFDDSTWSQFELVAGTDVGMVDVQAVTSAIDTSYGTSSYYDTVGEVVDWDYHLLFWAVENWVGQYDGYTYNKNNYYVWFNPAVGGKAQILPWDHDWAFCTSTPLKRPYGRISDTCYDDATCQAGFLTAMSEVAAMFDPGTDANDALAADIEARIALLEPYIEADPRKETSASSIYSSQDQLLGWIANRSDKMRSAWGVAK